MPPEPRKIDGYAIQKKIADGEWEDCPETPVFRVKTQGDEYIRLSGSEGEEYRVIKCQMLM